MGEGRRILEFPPSSTWREALLLLGVSAALAAFAWIVHPAAPSLIADADAYEVDVPVPLIAAETALAAYEHPDSYLVFVDARPGALELPYIPGAVPLRPDSLETDVRVLIEDFARDDPLILYGDDDLIVPAAVARALLEREFADVRILRGGFPAWLALGGPIAEPYGEVTP